MSRFAVAMRHWFLSLLMVTSGCGGDDDGSSPDAGGDIDAAGGDGGETTTVTGTVVDVDGYAMGSVIVIVDDLEPVLTNGSGEFTVTATTPYDVTIVDAPNQHVTKVIGLTKMEPWLQTTYRPERDNEATIEGLFLNGSGSGYENPNPLDTRMFVRANLVRGSGGTVILPEAAVTDYSAPISWTGSSSASGTIHALQFARVNNKAVDFYAYDSRSVSDVSDGETAVLPFTMDEVSTNLITGQVTVESGDDPAAVVSSVHFSDGMVFNLTSESTGSAFFSHSFPIISGATGSVGASWTGPEANTGILAIRAGLPVPSSEVAIVIPDLDLPLLVSPAPGAVDVGPGSTLRWQPVDSAAFVVTFVPSEFDSPSGRFTLMTSSDRVTLPDLSTSGVTYGANELYDWTQYGFADMTMDELASNDVVGPGIQGHREGVLLIGGRREVTTP